MKFSVRTIPAAAAMTAALLFGVQVQAQTAGQPATGSGDRATIPAGPNTMGKTMAQGDAAKPMAKPGRDAGATTAGGGSDMPGGPATSAMAKSAESRDAAKANKKKMRIKTGPPPKSSRSSQAYPDVVK